MQATRVLEMARRTLSAQAGSLAHSVAASREEESVVDTKCSHYAREAVDNCFDL